MVNKVYSLCSACNGIYEYPILTLADLLKAMSSESLCPDCTDKAKISPEEYDQQFLASCGITND
jgi:hypothetical protein